MYNSIHCASDLPSQPLEIIAGMTSRVVLLPRTVGLFRCAVGVHFGTPVLHDYFATGRSYPNKMRVKPGIRQPPRFFGDFKTLSEQERAQLKAGLGCFMSP